MPWTEMAMASSMLQNSEVRTAPIGVRVHCTHAAADHGVHASFIILCHLTVDRDFKLPFHSA